MKKLFTHWPFIRGFMFSAHGAEGSLGILASPHCSQHLKSYLPNIHWFDKTLDVTLHCLFRCRTMAHKEPFAAELRLWVVPLANAINLLSQTAFAAIDLCFNNPLLQQRINRSTNNLTQIPLRLMKCYYYFYYISLCEDNLKVFAFSLLICLQLYENM